MLYLPLAIGGQESGDKQQNRGEQGKEVKGRKVRKEKRQSKGKQGRQGKEEYTENSHTASLPTCLQWVEMTKAENWSPIHVSQASGKCQ